MQIQITIGDTVLLATPESNPSADAFPAETEAYGKNV